MYRTDGVKGFYRGLTPCMARAFPVAGAGFVVYEFILETVF